MRNPELKFHKQINSKAAGGGESSRLYWNDPAIFEAKIMIIITTHNNSHTIKRAISSALNQRGEISYGILIMDDSSQDDWIDCLKSYIKHPKISIAQGHAGKAWKARNLAHKILREHFTGHNWICRMDADDEFASDHVLMDIYSRIQAENPDAIWAISGNQLRVEDQLISRVNMPNPNLNDPKVLLEQLSRLKDLDKTAELPSCNLWVHREVSIPYPEIESAEDHWLVVNLLINYPNQGCILHDVLHTIYSLSGVTTQDNRKKGIYQTARLWLYNSACYWVNPKLVVPIITPICLGWGCEGMVWLEDNMVIKKFYANVDISLKKAWLEENSPKNDQHIPKAEWIQFNDRWQGIYSYKLTTSCEEQSITRIAISNFIQFLLKNRIVILNIARKNFRVKNNELYYIDIGPKMYPFEIRFFRDICARLYLLFVLGYSDIEMNRVTMKIRNNIEELQNIPGFEDFYRREMKLFFNKQGFNAKPPRNIESKREFEDITVLIKTCAMEYDQLKQSVYHITHQLCQKNQFAARVLLIDSKKENFLRQYTDGDLTQVIEIAEELVAENRIDFFLISPTDDTFENRSLIADVYKRWFNIQSNQTHSVRNIPVFAQLWGFEQINTRYVLQMDLDVIIHNGYENYDVLGEMLKALKAQEVFGVGYNICQPKNSLIREYSAPQGKFVPEVRFGLFDLERIRNQRPFPNTITEGKLQLSWYRSIEKYQEKEGWRSLRGGNPNFFYIHPPNTYKTNKYLLKKIINLIEQGVYPSSQRSNWDLIGTAKEWKFSARNESIIILMNITKDDIHWVRTCLKSIFAQLEADPDLGLIILNSSHSIKFRYWLLENIQQFQAKLTLVHMNIEDDIIDIISEVCPNPNSMLIGLNSDEAFIYPESIFQIRRLLTEKHNLIILGIFYDIHPLAGLAISPKNINFSETYKQFWDINYLRGTSIEYAHLLIDVLVKRNYKDEQTENMSLNKLLSMYSDEKILYIPEYYIYNSQLIQNIGGLIKNYNKIKRHSIYLPNLRRLEIDITYDCNLRCPGCCRSSAQAPEKFHMKMDTILNFLEETDRRGILWESVHILGGEPTLHPQFLEIITLLDDWFEKHSPKTDLKVISNGHGSYVNKQLQQMPQKWQYNNSFKHGTTTDYFEPFNFAPIDLADWRDADFRKGCYITQESGIGLTPYGYFHCAIAGGIERIMHLGYGFDKIPTHPWEFYEMMEKYCRVCGHFLNDRFYSREDQLKNEQGPLKISKTWEEAYRNWKDHI